MRTGFASLITIIAITLLRHSANATPSTNIWNPSTDIQATNVWHFGIDNYYSISANQTKPTAAPTDLGLTYGVNKNLEIGVDAFEPSANPIVFNAKFGLPEGKSAPAAAIGIQAVGTSNATAGNIGYALIAKTFPCGRFTVGGYTGKKSFLGGDPGGAILAWDHQFSPKWWGSVDYASGKNVYGALAIGPSYKFSSNTSVIFAYVIYNDHTMNRNDQITTQLDIDIK